MYQLQLTKFEAQLVHKILSWRRWLPFLAREEDATSVFIARRIEATGALQVEAEEEQDDAFAPTPPTPRHTCDHKLCLKNRHGHEAHPCHFRRCVRCRRGA
jgi:hypothetical protein